MKSFYRFYQQLLRESAPVGQNSGQPQAPGGGQAGAPPAPNTATQGQPAAPPGQNTGGQQPQGGGQQQGAGGGQGVAPPVPPPDPAVQQIQQLLNPMAAQLQGHIAKIQDPKVKQALQGILGQGNQQQKPQQQAQPQQPQQPPAQAGAAKPPGQQ